MAKKTRIAINGFGRIGRAFFKLALARPELEIVALNDLGDVHNLEYLLKYDTAYGKSDLETSVSEDGTHLIVNGNDIRFLQEKDPLQLPWGDLGIDIVIEATGVFRHYEKANMHITAGAKRVVISAPAKGEPLAGVESATVLMGVNEEKLATCSITSNASCTTNAASPVVTIMEETLNIEKALLDTIHSYTSTQRLVDAPSKDWRKGRAAAQNLVPTSTGAATALTKAVPGVPFFDGISVRVPSIVGSYVDLTFVTKKDTTAEEVNDILRAAAKEDRWKGIFRVSDHDEQLVSSDIIGETHASIADLDFTRVVGGNLVKVMAWYDNETGYSNALVEHVVRLGKHLPSS